MSNYTKTTNFTVKDSLSSSNPAKVIKGAEFDAEFDAIAVAVSSNLDSGGSTFSSITLNGVNVLDGSLEGSGIIDGGTY